MTPVKRSREPRRADYSDVYYLWQALLRHYRDGDDEGLDSYSKAALARIWKAERFSKSMTRLLHRFAEQSAFEQRMQEAEFAYLESSPAAQAALAENYIGLPYRHTAPADAPERGVRQRGD